MSVRECDRKHAFVRVFGVCVCVCVCMGGVWIVHVCVCVCVMGGCLEPMCVSVEGGQLCVTVITWMSKI